MIVSGGIRAQGLLTRSWIVTPASSNYRAGKDSRSDPSRTYKCFADIRIRRSPRPYYIRSRPHSSTSRSSSSSAIPHISLHIAASSSGKGRKLKLEESTFEYDPDSQDALGIQRGETLSQKRYYRPDSGQDAYFVAKVGRSPHTTAFGILDGVGGWATHGIDPADFSHGLSSHMARTALEWSGDKLGPRRLLEIGYQKTIQDPHIAGGGTTACVAVADPNGRMMIANLGDSGFLQVRMGAVHHYSNPQTHAFNTPYQMSISPPFILQQAAIFGGMPLNDTPNQADLADHMLRHGDVLVLATDGVWDNLNSQEVLHIVSRQMRIRGAWARTADNRLEVADKLSTLTTLGQSRGIEPQPTLQASIAAAIVAEAKAASINSKRDGPFAKEVQKHYPGESFSGGKVDDISVLVIVPVNSEKVQALTVAKL